MQVLHLDLKPIQDNYVELRYFEGNPNDYQSRSLPLTEITDLIQIAERDYYTVLPEDHQITGERLFDWLDGNDRFFQQLLNKQRGKGIVLAISTLGNISHLPWELLHDGKSFLVERKPGIIPVRWVSSDEVKQLSIKPQPENRALQMLFMATSPLNLEPVLDFEREEANILEVTARQPLTLTVEESGCLEELGFLVENYGKEYGKEDNKQYFDVLHLTGHATIDDGVPAFITESPTGEAVYSTADDIATELQFQLPKLIFLSGCRTGQAGNFGTVPSMAQSLLEQGAKSVLGWGQSVLDTDATSAAAALYQALSAGKLLTEALALTYQALIKNNARDWHLLRLYVADTLPGNLVTPLRTRGRKPAPPRSFSSEFLDPAGKVKVPTRESFVGRRRQLQNCLRILMNPSAEEIGVLIHGMGGLGKSSLAARLCDRLTNFQRVVWVGRIDETSLVRRLTEKLDSKDLRETLQNPDEELKFRLKRVFAWLQENGDKPFLLVLDDFETNLEPRNDSYILKTEAEAVLSALVWAINQTYAPHRIIITCRYDFESSHLQDFYKQPLEGMRGADLRKKLSRLTAFNQNNQDNQAQSQVDETLKAQAQRLADGNPRLLEWLDKVLLRSDVDVAEILNRLETDPVELREQVLAKQLLQQMDDTMRGILQRGLVFELPVPREALEVVCENIADLDNYIDKAVALGLLEVSPEQSLRVPRILPLKLPVIATVGNNPQDVIATQVRAAFPQGNSNPQATVIETDTTIITAQESNPKQSQISPEIFKAASHLKQLPRFYIVCGGKVEKLPQKNNY
ncbi:CHAT domain-containing protein [Mastigocoleus testarum]|uniref:CHAT domain-containing protein n=1 Tax=Mastigocoleus testarum TaxID=996925 RepID=UPI0004068503|nr:CHAT domain-containing protein [Mastigocoleus testarum]